MDLPDLPRATRDLIDREVRPGERILWVGRPSLRRAMLLGVVPMLFAIPWTAFAIFWMYGAAGATQHGAPWPFALFPLFGLPFVLIGIGMFTAPLWIRRAALRSAYVVTDQRAICIAWRVLRAEISSYPAAALQRMPKTVGASGAGDLIFEERYQGRGAMRRIGFIGLDDVQAVERIIREGILHAEG
jgi:hypothetical protein